MRLALLCFSFMCGCGTTATQLDSGSDQSAPPTDSGVRPDVQTIFHPDASCLVTITAPETPAAAHVDEGTPITYPSNPSSGGAHYPRWATYGPHSNPIPAPYWVHNLEHGAVVLLHKCDPDAGTPCNNGQMFLTQASAALPDDPSCTAAIRVRTVIAPEPNLPTPFAASAWGWTYTAACSDMPTLVEFAKAHYAKGPEDTCAEGSY